MKRIFAILISIFTMLSWTYSQDLKPTDSLALFKVQVTNLKDIPSKGDKITFVNSKTGKSYSGISGADGCFNILIPKGERLEVRFLSLGKDSTLRTIDVPAQEGLVTMNYKLRYELPKIITLDNIYFDTNRATLKPISYETLNNLVELLLLKSNIVIEIAGHTDSQGGAQANLILSQNRANAVKTYLVKKGIKAERVQAVGYGLTQPIDTNDTPEGRSHNRRTEAHIISE